MDIQEISRGQPNGLVLKKKTGFALHQNIGQRMHMYII